MQDPLDAPRTLVSVHLKKAAGFNGADDMSRIFVRAETKQLWEAIVGTAAAGKNLMVEGPPGTGKSTEVWAWAIWVARENKKVVTWFHTDRAKCVKVVIDGQQNNLKIFHNAELSSIRNSAGNYLVVDGVTSDKVESILQSCTAWKASNPEFTFIAVTSAAVKIAVEQLEGSSIETFTVASWTFDQYVDACADESFFEEIKINLKCPPYQDVESKEAMLLSKFECAGGSARWMFEFNYNTWERDFQAHMRGVTDYKRLFDEGGGDEARLAANHLRGVTVENQSGGWQLKNYFFISKRVVQELSKRCCDAAELRKFILTSYRQAEQINNPAYRGWIFEFDVELQLCDSLKLGKLMHFEIRSYGDNPNTHEERAVNSYITFKNEAELVAAMKGLPVTQVMWAKPAKWCQTSYDYLCFWQINGLWNMVAANATWSQKHTANLLGVRDLATALGNNGCVIAAIRFDFLCPLNSTFEVSSVQGRLCEWKNLMGELWPNSPRPDAYLDKRCIVVNYFKPTE